MTVRVRCRVNSTDRSSDRWTSGTSTPSGTTVTLVGQWVTSRRIVPKERERASTAKAPTRVKGKGFDNGKDKTSGRYQGYGYQGACHFCGEVEHKRAECWKYWKDHQNQIRVVDEQEEETIEQVGCQTC